MSQVLAFDFGASGGRAILAKYDAASGSLKYEEIHRFENGPMDCGGKLCWDFPYLLAEIKKGIEKACEICGKPDSLAFDTWGVDYGLIDGAGKIMGLPANYRDPRTKNMPDKAYEKIAPEKLYAATGNQIMPINTLFQLMAEDNNGASLMLFMPDLFAYALCGAKNADQTIASTSQMLDMKSKGWCADAFALTGKNPKILPQIVSPATVAGEYDGIKVIKVAGHDTQCAVCAMPASDSQCAAFLSCGTWSLIGCECDEPILTEKSMLCELSNELGANGKINYLKNISGLWLIQEIRRNFRAAGREYSYNDMEQLARKAEPFKCFIDPDSPEFALPGEMPEKIRAFCRASNQAVPESDGELIRSIYDRLAMKYRFAIDQIKENTGKNFDVLHLLGGGTKDGFLCQMAANSLQIPVAAGPTEATALGNIMLQLIALGDIKNVEEGRKMIKTQEQIKYYAPADGAAWEKAYSRYAEILNK